MENISFYEREIHPLKQAAFFAGVTVLLLGLIKVLQLSDVLSSGTTLYFEISLMIILIFGIFNSVMGLPYKDQSNYWFYSTIAYILIAVLGAVLSYFLCDLDPDKLGVYKIIYFVFTFGYLVFLSIIRSMRKIVQIAQREDARMRGEDDFEETTRK